MSMGALPIPLHAIVRSMIFSEGMQRRREAKSWLGRTRRSTERQKPGSEEESRELREDLGRPLINDSWQESGSFNFELPPLNGIPTHVSISYDSVLGAEFLKRYWRMVDVYDEYHMAILDTSRRRIKNIILQRPGHEFNLRDVVGDTPAYVYIGDEEIPPLHTKGGGEWDPVRYLALFVHHDIRSLEGLGTLLHEVGHFLTIEPGGKYKGKFAPKNTREKFVWLGSRAVRRAERLSMERSATAYALSVLRNFVDKDTLSKLHQNLHNALWSYHQRLRTQRYNRTK